MPCLAVLEGPGASRASSIDLEGKRLYMTPGTKFLLAGTVGWMLCHLGRGYGDFLRSRDSSPVEACAEATQGGRDMQGHVPPRCVAWLVPSMLSNTVKASCPHSGPTHLQAQIISACQGGMRVQMFYSPPKYLLPFSSTIHSLSKDRSPLPLQVLIGSNQLLLRGFLLPYHFCVRKMDKNPTHSVHIQTEVSTVYCTLNSHREIYVLLSVHKAKPSHSGY